MLLTSPSVARPNDGADNRPDPPTGPSGPPFAQWIYPPDGSVVSGRVEAQVLVSDSIGVVSPVGFYYVKADAGPDRLGHSFKERARDDDGRRHGDVDVTPTTLASDPYQPVVATGLLDTAGLGDRDYRISGVVSGVGGQTTTITEQITVDNAAPEVAIDQPRGNQAQLIDDPVPIVVSVHERHISSWSAYAEIPGSATLPLGSGTTEVNHQQVATWSGHMAPAGYVGPVDIVLTATDSALPRPNVTSEKVTLISDYSLNAYGTLGLRPTYEVSATVPVTATVTGEVSKWSLSVNREGRGAPMYENSGSEPGGAIAVGAFDVKRFGPGNYVFSLVTTDRSGHQDHSVVPVTFRWTPAKMTVTYIGPAASGPMPTDHPLAEFEDPAVSGTVEIRGEITGTNVMAWAIGRPIQAENPAFSPDGTRVVFASSRGDWPTTNTDIYTLKADGSGLLRLTYDTALDYAPRFSPDGSEIVFSSTRNYPAGAEGTDLYVMNQDGTNVRRITDFGYAEYPSWSPDGERIAFDGTIGQESGLFVMGADGSDLTQVAGVGLYPVFSPDSTRLVFSYFDYEDPYFHIATVDLTSPEHAISNIGAGIEPSYSPDGSKIVYVDPSGALNQMGADGQTPTAYGVNGNDPVFTPDGQSVVYSDPYGQIVMIPQDPAQGAYPQVVIEDDGYNRVPGTATTETAFPPSKTVNNRVPIDISSFQEGSYLKTPPYQFPTETMPPDSVIGHIDTNKLPAGQSRLAVTVIQCDAPIPPLAPFIYRPGEPEDPETSATISTLRDHCNAYDTSTVILQVQVNRVHVAAEITVSETATGYAGPLSRPKVFTASGTWQPDDSWAFRIMPAAPESLPVIPEVPKPDLARAGNAMWATGEPATDGNFYRPVGDLMGLEYMKVLVNEPITALATLAGSAPTLVDTNDFFAPGRSGDKYQIDLPAGHFGGASRLFAWVDKDTQLLGALEYHNSYFIEGPTAAPPGVGPWGAPTGTTRSSDVRLVFGDYGKDLPPSVPVVKEAAP